MVAIVKPQVHPDWEYLKLVEEETKQMTVEQRRAYLHNVQLSIAGEEAVLFVFTHIVKGVPKDLIYAIECQLATLYSIEKWLG